MKTKKHFARSKIIASLALLALGLPSYAADMCAEGDQKCGANGNVLVCRRFPNHPSFDLMWHDTVTTKCQGPAAATQGSSTYSVQNQETRKVCTEGATQCGADGYVEQCRSREWRITANKSAIQSILTALANDGLSIYSGQA